MCGVLCWGSTSALIVNSISFDFTDKEAFRVFFIFSFLCFIGHIVFFSCISIFYKCFNIPLKYIFSGLVSYVILTSLVISLILYDISNLMLMHDVETNPGPKCLSRIVTIDRLLCANSLLLCIALQWGFTFPHLLKYLCSYVLWFCIWFFLNLFISKLSRKLVSETVGVFFMFCRFLRVNYRRLPGFWYFSKLLIFDIETNPGPEAISKAEGEEVDLSCSEDFDDIINDLLKGEDDPDFKPKLIVFSVKLLQASLEVIPEMEGVNLEGTPGGSTGPSWFGALRSILPTVKLAMDPATLQEIKECAAGIKVNVDTDIGREINKVANKISAEDVQRVAHLAGATADCMDIFTQVMTKIRDFDLSKILRDKRLLVTMVVACLGMCYRAGQIVGSGESLWDHKILLCLIGLVIFIIAYYSSDLLSLVYPLLRFFSVTPQADQDFLDIAIKPVVSTLTYSPVINAFDLVWRKVEKYHKNFKITTSILHSFSEIFDLALRYTFPLLRIISEYTQIPLSTFISSRQLRVQELYDHTLSVLELFGREDKKLTYELINRFTVLEGAIDKELKELQPSAENSFLRSTLLSLKSQLQPISKCMQARGGTMTKPMPFMLYLYGRSNCGKTTFLSNILMPLLVREVIPDDLVGEYRDNPSLFTYEKDSSKWWEGYTSNVVGVFYTDLFCAKDRPGADASDAQTLISVGGTNKHKLPIAGIEGKADTYFTSPVILAASNVRYITPEVVSSINNSDALCNRMNRFAFEMHLKTEWALNGKLDFQKFSAYRSANNGLIPDFAYFEKIDVRPPHTTERSIPVPDVGKCYSTTEFIKLCIKQVRVMMTTQDHSLEINNAFFQHFVEHKNPTYDPDAAPIVAVENIRGEVVVQADDSVDVSSVPRRNNFGFSARRARRCRRVSVKPESSSTLFEKFDRWLAVAPDSSFDLVVLLRNAVLNRVPFSDVRSGFGRAFSKWVAETSSGFPDLYIEHCEALLLSSFLTEGFLSIEGLYSTDGFLFCREVNDVSLLQRLYVEYLRAKKVPKWWESFKDESIFFYHRTRLALTTTLQSALSHFDMLKDSPTLWGKFFKHTWLFTSNLTLSDVGLVTAGVVGLLGIIDFFFPVKPKVIETTPAWGKKIFDDKEKASAAVINNCVRISIVQSKDGKDISTNSVNAVFLHGRYLLVVNHFVTMLEDLSSHGCSKVFVNLVFFKENNAISSERPFNKIPFGTSVVRVPAPELLSRDLAILSFKSNVVDGCKGVMNFLPSVTWDSFNRGLKTGYESIIYRRRTVLECDSTTITTGRRVCSEVMPRKCEFCDHLPPGKGTLDCECLYLNSESMAGDCGMLGFCVDPSRTKYQSVWPTIANPIIVYYHVAGFCGKGVGVPIYKEDFFF